MTSKEIEEYALSIGLFNPIQEYVGRRLGSTTRIIDQCVQYLFTKGFCVCIDDYYHGINDSMRVQLGLRIKRRVLDRLAYEHDFKIEKMVKDGSLILGQKGDLRIAFSDEFFKKMIHNVAETWVAAKKTEDGIKNQIDFGRE